MKGNSNDAHFTALREAFDTPWPGPWQDGILLKNGDLKVVIHPEDGCRITSFNAGGLELLRQWHSERRAFQYGCFPMIPWVGRMKDAAFTFNGQRHAMPMNKPPFALHGLACFAPWQVLSRSATGAAFQFTLDDLWPWKGRVVQRIALSPDELTLSLTIETAQDDFPAAAGWHPWFNKWCDAPGEIGPKAEQLQLAFNADWQERTGADELPEGQHIPPQPGPWDDSFGFGQGVDVTLSWPGRLRLHMTSEANTLVVFEKQPDATCVEPLTGVPDCINTAPGIVSKNRPLTITTRWRVEK